MAKIFISYKRTDKDVVFPVFREIKEKTGIDCWIDLKGIESGDRYEGMWKDGKRNGKGIFYKNGNNKGTPQTWKDDIQIQ